MWESLRKNENFRTPSVAETKALFTNYRQIGKEIQYFTLCTWGGRKRIIEQKSNFCGGEKYFHARNLFHRKFFHIRRCHLIKLSTKTFEKHMINVPSHYREILPENRDIPVFQMETLCHKCSIGNKCNRKLPITISPVFTFPLVPLSDVSAKVTSFEHAGQSSVILLHTKALEAKSFPIWILTLPAKLPHTTRSYPQTNKLLS